MKTKLLSLFLILTMGLNYAQENPNSTTVKSYTKKDGTHVESYKRTKSNRTERDNYSSKPNRNPYTGKKGTRTPKK